MSTINDVVFKVKGKTVSMPETHRLPKDVSEEAFRRFRILGSAVAGFTGAPGKMPSSVAAIGGAGAMTKEERDTQEVTEFEEKLDALENKVRKEFEDLKEFLNQSPTVREVPGGFGLFYTDTSTLRGSGDMFDRYVSKSRDKDTAKEIVEIVKSHKKMSSTGKPYIRQEDLPAIKKDVLEELGLGL
tara:strand:- start:8 stop:565 length:558 start_codon:yes stop_codon:yes gene_type:complete